MSDDTHVFVDGRFDLTPAAVWARANAGECKCVQIEVPCCGGEFTCTDLIDDEWDCPVHAECRCDGDPADLPCPLLPFPHLSSWPGTTIVSWSIVVDEDENTSLPLHPPSCSADRDGI